MSTFDKKAADIVEKGNVYTSLPFLNQARQLAAEKFAAFEEKQASYDREIERFNQQGDSMTALVLEARKTYEASAYERDTAQSVLAKYQVLYGADSKNYKEQEADVAKLTAQADSLYAKLEAVTEMESQFKEALKADALKTASTEAPQANQPETETVAETPEIVEQEQAVETKSPMMEGLRERIEAAKEDQAFEEGWQEFQSSEMEPPTTEADDAEARADEILRAMDEGRDPYSDGYDDFEAQEAAVEDALEREMSGEIVDEIDPDGDAQIAEDRHFAAEMPQDLEFEAPEDHDREYVMAPVHRYEDRDAKKSQASSDVSTASLTQEFSESDRNRLDQMENRVDTAVEQLTAAKKSGDADAISEARQSLADANSDFKEYLSDRQDYKSQLAEVKSDAQRLVNKDPADRASAAQDFKESYSKASESIERMEQDGKPWAAEMRRDLQETAQQYHQQDVEKRGDADAGKFPTVAKTVQEAERSRDEDRIEVAAPSPSVIASYQAQVDAQREAQH
jgi:hypothetical protein